MADDRREPPSATVKFCRLLPWLRKADVMVPKTPEEWDRLIDETVRTGDAAVAMDNLGYGRRRNRRRAAARKRDLPR